MSWFRKYFGCFFIKAQTGSVALAGDLISGVSVSVSATWYRFSCYAFNRFELDINLCPSIRYYEVLVWTGEYLRAKVVGRQWIKATMDEVSNIHETLIAEDASVCAWCREWYDKNGYPTGIPLSNEQYEAIESHGICKACSADQLEQLKINRKKVEGLKG